MADKRDNTMVVQVSHTSESSFWEDLKHDLRMNWALMPAYVGVTILIVLLLVLRATMVGEYPIETYLLLVVGLGTYAYLIAFVILAGEQLSRTEKWLMVISGVAISFTIVYCLGGALLSHGVISEFILNLVFPGFVVGFQSMAGAFMVNKLNTLSSRVLTSLYIFAPAFFASILAYGYFGFVLWSKLDPMIEVLIGGVCYPLAVALVGKILVCDFSSYLLHLVCGIPYVQTVDFMVGFMRIILFMNLQTAVFMLDSLPAFVLALASNISIELLFLPFNIKFATLDNFKKLIRLWRGAKVSPSASSNAAQDRKIKKSKSILEDWFTFDRLPPAERYCRYYFNEALAEKVSLVGVIAVGFTLHIRAGRMEHNMFAELVSRSALLILFELLEDFTKRRLLWYFLRVNMSDIEVHLNWKANLQYASFTIVSVSFLLLGESLARTVDKS